MWICVTHLLLSWSADTQVSCDDDCLNILTVDLCRHVPGRSPGQLVHEVDYGLAVGLALLSGSYHHTSVTLPYCITSCLDGFHVFSLVSSEPRMSLK